MAALSPDPEVDQLKAALRDVAGILGNFALHLRLSGLTPSEVRLVLGAWNEWMMERADAADD